MNPLTNRPRPNSVAQRLLQEASSSWQRALGMRFIRQATEGSLDDDVFARYLIIEAGFVETSARLRGAAILHAPTRAALDSHREALNSLMTDHHEYLRQALRRFKLSATITPRARQQADTLSTRMLEISRTCTYPEIIVAMFAAEELYESWCSRAMTLATKRQPVLEDWIVAHTKPPFTEQVAFLVDEIDVLDVAEPEVLRLGSLVAEVLDLECAFHDAAYLTG